MYREKIKNEYDRWLKKVKDEALYNELLSMQKNEELKKEAFYRHLSFGTGGLRGKLGAGCNRMNIYTVRRATQGLAKYISSFKNPSCAIGYDTRIMSPEFAKEAALVLSMAGIKVYIYSEPLPTPMLSYAVRRIGTTVGIMITASHNPSVYNGYKVYGSDGCQITDNDAEAILGHINSSDYFDFNEECSYEALVASGKIEIIGNEVYRSYLEEVTKTSALYEEAYDNSIKIVYTPLNGTGFKPVTDVLSLVGYKNLTVVKEQASPDGNFTTCKKPNPELDEALSLGITYLKETKSDILIATDPDSDRIGVVVNNNDEYCHLSGNEVGVLLLDYVLSQKAKHNALCKKALCIKTIVTTPLAERIAENYGAVIKNTLTGFKYIGEMVGRNELSDEFDFVFGFEESCGYLGGNYVRDKDGVYGAMIVSEMAAYYKNIGKSLLERLKELYLLYGYTKTRLLSFEYEGAEGEEKIAGLMKKFREEVTSIAALPVTKKLDYSKGIDELPVSDVVELLLDGGHNVIIRPSGTEPKIKIYIFAKGTKSEEAERILESIASSKELSL